jgi:hypothetical protein
MPCTVNLEDLSNDDLLVQLNELCEEVGERLGEYEEAEDRETLAEALSFANAAKIAVKCRTGRSSIGLDGLWWSIDALEKRAAEARLAGPRGKEAFDGFIDEHPELKGGDDA